MTTQIGGHLTKGPKPVFVFGSNLAGRHGKGAAKDARLFYGAIYGKGVGMHGNSYAIPTKDEQLNVLQLSEIAVHVTDFLDFARRNPQLQFNVTKVGCGLAGYLPEQIGPMFTGAPDNCCLPPEFESAITSMPLAHTSAPAPIPATPSQRRNILRTR
ncbi:hypothetical protein [Hydrogenophaga sp. 2FB]|uniref:A1S_2505 family phage non-structural protein n=1 Tax=Hydrogenophaga sp. 2FB TaxID=2502187 RepID=UPI001BB0F914|nr:hypothetical protein [Hydrogenophaga sp. 2FB]